MSILDVIAGLFGQGTPAAEEELPPHLAELLPEALEFVVNTVEPKLRYASGYPDKLEAAVRHTLVFLGGLEPDLPEPIKLRAADWNSDPRLNAFFRQPRRYRHDHGAQQRVARLLRGRRQCEPG